jgi:hypothetical protein
MQSATKERNKEHDFKNVENAATIMQDFLRQDETHPDLQDQFYFRNDLPGCHQYFVEPYKNIFGSMVSPLFCNSFLYSGPNFFSIPTRLKQANSFHFLKRFLSNTHELNVPHSWVFCRK